MPGHCSQSQLFCKISLVGSDTVPTSLNMPLNGRIEKLRRIAKHHMGTMLGLRLNLKLSYFCTHNRHPWPLDTLNYEVRISIIEYGSEIYAADLLDTSQLGWEMWAMYSPLE